MISIKKLYIKAFITIICVFFVGTIQTMEDKSIKIDGLQILINPQADWFKFKSVVDGKVINNFVTPRPAGSTFKEKCLVFPKNTIDVINQQSFLVDKNGNPLTKETSIGIWKCAGKALVETSIATPPPTGTCFEESTWNFIFNQDKSNKGLHVNYSKISAHGKHTTMNDVLQPGKELVKNELTITETTGNKKLIGKGVHGKAYVAPDGQSFVIEVTFDKKIIINFTQ